MYRVVMLLLGLSLAACSDDGSAKDSGTDTGPTQDGALEMGTDAGADLRPDKGTPPPCDEANLFKPCTQGGSECGAVNTCLLTAGTSGFCSCGCFGDDPGTTVLDEDSCPGADVACGVDGPSGESHCFKLAANTPQHPNCSQPVAIVADPTDTAFMVAARVVPPSVPFTLTGIRYLLDAPHESKLSECDTGLAHRAEVHVNDQDTPTASPTPLETFNVPATAATTDPRWVVHGLATPVQLAAGEAIYVLLEVVRHGAKSTCAAACPDNSATGEHSFIDVDSNQPPYQWETFKSKQWEGELSFAVLGF